MVCVIKCNLASVLYGFETWSLTFREAQRLLLFENKLITLGLRETKLQELGQSHIMLSYMHCILHLTSSSDCSAQGQILHCKGRFFTVSAGSHAAVLPKAGIPPKTPEPRLQFYLGLNRCCSFPFFPHPTLFLASEQNLEDLKNPRITNVEVRRVHLANWALRTPPKFTTGVKYQFHQGF